ncbi:MAG: GDSL-type esterase/lipase family protein [Oscillospiraceae bacterium]|nr:GDSL-type esterase/lipase family protein [Oscillospiraceae bacterium]
MKWKPITVIFTAILTAEALLPAAVNAVSGTDIRHLVKSLTTGGQLIADDDFDGNKMINALDLTLMKRSLFETPDLGDLTEQTITNITDVTKVIGRTVTKDSVTWLVQSGAAVECIVTGTEASVIIAGDGHTADDEKYRPRYGVYVDGELVKDVVMGDAEQTVSLFTGTNERTATVKVMHLSEANNGAIGVKAFNVTSKKSEPIKPTPKKDLTIEFVGDSITCAYGVGADSQYVGFETATEDFSKSYAYLTAQLLDADYSAVSYSGYGIYSGYSGDGKRNTDSLVPPIYELVAKFGGYDAKWDFDANPNDVVFINLGTNDDSYAKDDLETRAPLYQAAYVDFLRDVRKCNPDAVIVCTLGIMGCTELYPSIEAAVKEVGDPKIFCYESPTHNIQRDGIGADWHPSSVTHVLNSYLAANNICKALGIEYSGIGLDFAAGGEYGAELNAESGAAGWPYYAEWNKSLNLNITSGGKNAEDVIGYVRGLNLKSGTYELSFTVKGADKIEFPYVLRSMADPETVYCSGVVTAAEMTKEFEMKAPAEDCEIVFLLGEAGSANVTFENVFLYKRE